jgi:hypothetical protein
MALRWAAAAMQKANQGLPSIEGIQASAGGSRCYAFHEALVQIAEAA